MPFFSGWYDDWTSTTTSSTDPWYHWITTTSTTNSTHNIVWRQWITTDHDQYRMMRQMQMHRQVSQAINNFIQDPPRIVQTADEIREQKRRHEEAKREARKRAERAAAALKRAESLLERYLTPEQWADYKKNKGFVVCVKGGRRYRINDGVVGNVHQLDEKGKIIARLCAHVPHEVGVPLPDQHLTQLFMLRHHEEDFLRTANHHPLH